AVAAIMLVIGGDQALNGIQNITFIGALPFTVVLIVLCFSLTKDVRSDPMMQIQTKGAEVLEEAVLTGTEEYKGDFELVTRPANNEDPGSAAPPDHPPRRTSSSSGRANTASNPADRSLDATSPPPPGAASARRAHRTDAALRASQCRVPVGMDGRRSVG